MRRWLSTKGRLGRRLLRRNRNALVGVLAALGAVVLLVWLVLYVLPPTLVPAWTAFIQAVAGVALLIGLLFTARTLRLNRQGQITERFTKAIEQLGDSSKLDVRLGGIYALERIARDSADDHRTIMEVLTAFLREHSREATQAQGSATQKDAGRRLRTDLQAVATVLGRRRREYEGERDQLDLGGVHLEGAILRGAHLEGADLRGAHLERADLVGAHLEEAFLMGARLEEAFLMGARLERAILRGAHLEGAILRGAHLEGADLRGAHLERADLVGAHLEEAFLRGANLEGAFLMGARLERADLVGARLEGAILMGAHLEEAFLMDARLERADLVGANLDGADLGGAHLDGADLGGAHLEGAHASPSTTWPEDFDPEAKGVTIDH